MNYDKEIPDFAMLPAKEADIEEDFDPSPYEKLLNMVNAEPVSTDGKALVATTESVEASTEAMCATTEPAETSTGALVTTTEAETHVSDTDASMEASASLDNEEHLTEAETEALYTETGANTPFVDTENQLEEITKADKEPDTMPAGGLLIIPKDEDLITNHLKMTDIREKAEKRIFIEEDILVPDTKEDLASILSMTGTVKLHTPEIRVDKTTEGNIAISGDIELHTLYLPERYKGEHHIISIQSKVPFKTDWKLDAATGSRLVICPHIEDITYTVVNERKFRAKLELKLCVREYANVEMEVFQGLKEEKLQLLKEKIQITHVSERKNDTIQISEILPLKETQPKPEKILQYDLNIVENHKQVSEDKAVINATVYCNILYLGETVPEKNTAGESTNAEMEQSSDPQGKDLVPQLYQNKVEFTQFIPINNKSEGSRITFKNKDLSVRIKDYGERGAEQEAEDDQQTLSENQYSGKKEKGFILEGSVETAIELYKNLEREIVTDVYHNKKDIICDKVELESMSLGGSGMTETTVREIVNVPEDCGDIKKVIYICGNVKACTNHFEQNKNQVEGIMEITLLCLPEDSTHRAFRLNRAIPFKANMEIPAGKLSNKASSEVAVKELWFDKINAKQIEVNANLCIYSSVYCQEKYHVIQNVCFLENAQEKGNQPGMVVYITKEGDTLWSIAKRYRTTVNMIMEINELEEGQSIYPGQKLLIVK